MSVLHNLAITAGGTAEDLLPERPGRRSLIISPITEDCWVAFGETAAVDNGELIPVDTSSRFSIPEFGNIWKALSVFSATTGAKIMIREG